MKINQNLLVLIGGLCVLYGIDALLGDKLKLSHFVIDKPSPINATPLDQNDFQIVKELESDAEYAARLKKIDRVFKNYHLNRDRPYLYIGEEKSVKQSSKQVGNHVMTVSWPTTPSVYSVVYLAGEDSAFSGDYIYVDKSSGYSKVYELPATDVKLISDFPEMKARIRYQNIRAMDDAEKQLIETFAERLVSRKICPSIRSAARYERWNITAFCGDGMEYRMSLQDIQADAPIQTRIVREYAQFNRPSGVSSH
ncbi:hypothetical protein [Photobacterium galatheae]|uniref:Uncharacterized protein n=1 Tax=Photobacterium galatheae TaxID=1654360 RepID=A0A066RIE8_9GAMM|nr:hypothetical protein [Photobacterium galatheae]KDM90104.1 hypothetical protein EA58_19415 [Photobacterium galatheae]MCM0150085.1 hypothetical protein [Photobacterium galatheae]